jgi:hypothetical protein
MKLGLLRLGISVATVAIGASTFLSAQDPGGPDTGVSVLTWQYDNARTGQNLDENVLLRDVLHLRHRFANRLLRIARDLDFAAVDRQIAAEK